MPRRRLTNQELAFLENVTASAVGIIQKVKALGYSLDDPEELQIVLDILQDAKAIRKRTIEETARRKGER